MVLSKLYWPYVKTTVSDQNYFEYWTYYLSTKILGSLTETHEEQQNVDKQLARQRVCLGEAKKSFTHSERTDPTLHSVHVCAIARYGF